MPSYDAAMRTTLDLSRWVHAQLTDVAKKENTTMSAVADRLLAKGLLSENLPEGMAWDPLIGLPYFTGGPPITSEQVKEWIAEDEEWDEKQWMYTKTA